MKIKNAPPSRAMRKFADGAGAHWTRWLRKHLMDARTAKGLSNETVKEMFATDEDQ